MRPLQEQRGLSMQELAANLDIEYNKLYQIKTCKINTSISMVQKLAEELNTTHQELFAFSFPVK